MLKIDYERAWKELKNEIGDAVMEGGFTGDPIKNIMQDLEQKHKKEYKEHRAGYGEKPTTERPKPKPRP